VSPAAKIVSPRLKVPAWMASIKTVVLSKFTSLGLAVNVKLRLSLTWALDDRSVFIVRVGGVFTDVMVILAGVPAASPPVGKTGKFPALMVKPPPV